MFFDFEWVAKLVDEFDTAICFDGGHWCLMGNDLSDFVERFAPRIRSVHCHDVRDGVDHQPLKDPTNLPWAETIAKLREREYKGPVQLECASIQHTFLSLPTLEWLAGG